MSIRPAGGCAVGECSRERLVAGATRDTGAAGSAPASPGAPICTCGHVALLYRSGVAALLRRLVDR